MAASSRLSGEATPAISSHFVAYRSNINYVGAEGETDDVSQKRVVDAYLGVEIDDNMGREKSLSNAGHKEKASGGGGSDRARLETLRWDKRDAVPIRSGSIGGASEEVDQDVDMNQPENEQNDEPVSPRAPAEQPAVPRSPVHQSTAPQSLALNSPVKQPSLKSQPPAKRPVELQPHAEKRKRKEVNYSDMQGQVKRPKYHKDNSGDDVAGQGSQRGQVPRWERLEDEILVNFSFLWI